MPGRGVETIAEYLAGLPKERRSALEAARKFVRRHLPPGYRERVGWGGISYEVPLERYPDTYNGKPLAYACLAAQKSHCALYLMGVYQVPEQAAKLRAAFAAAGKKADMGKSCIRFRTLDDLPLEAIGTLVAGTPVEAFLAQHEAGRKRTPTAPKAARSARKPPTIDEYLVTLDPDQRAALEKLRRAIRKAAPSAEEGFSYGLPAFRLNGKPIAGFAAGANHCAYYPMSGAIVAAHRAELASYETSKGAIRFQPSGVLPARLVRKLVKARVAEAFPRATGGRAHGRGSRSSSTNGTMTSK